jgi:hypothetical protein
MRYPRVILFAAIVCLSAPSWSDSPASAATLALTVFGGEGPVQKGDLIIVTIFLSDIGKQEAAGFQSFIAYDTSRLNFVIGAYPQSPFGLPIITPIQAIDGEIDLAAGVDTFNGQPPTSSPAHVVALVFQVLEDAGCVTSIHFRPHEPPTRVTDPKGNALEPLLLVDLPFESPNPDINGDGVVDVLDLLILLDEWGPCENPGDCPADLNCNGIVEVLDLLILVDNWG